MREFTFPLRAFAPSVLALAALAPPAGATTLVRTGLDRLVDGNETVVVGEVVDAVSYWNAEGTFILTDVTVAPEQVLKGEAKGHLTVTLMGGTVGETTTLILAGAELIPGRSYLLFLGPDDLPGAPGALTVPYHAQGAFDLVESRAGLRAVSQATRHQLVPDGAGLAEAPGGAEGLALEELAQSVRRLADGSAGGGR